MELCNKERIKIKIKTTTKILIFALFSLLFISSSYNEGGFGVSAQSVSSDSILQLCGTSAMASTANSGFSGSSGTRFTKFLCDPVQNALIVNIFNAVQTTNCAARGTISSTTFTVTMTCSGPENNGNGITGSLSQSIINGTNVFNSAGIVLQSSETSDDLIISLDDGDASISGRTCTATIRGDLWAQESPGGECFACLNVPILSTTETCGIVNNDDDDCNYFDIICHMDEGTWTESSFFWIILFIFITILAVAIYIAILNVEQDRIRSIVNKVNENISSYGNGVDNIDTKPGKINSNNNRFVNNKSKSGYPHNHNKYHHQKQNNRQNIRYRNNIIHNRHNHHHQHHQNNNNNIYSDNAIINTKKQENNFRRRDIIDERYEDDDTSSSSSSSSSSSVPSYSSSYNSSSSEDSDMLLSSNLLNPNNKIDDKILTNNLLSNKHNTN